MKKGKKGFSLIEIIIVVAIVGLLASMGGVWVSKVMHNSRVETAETELHLISSAILEMAYDTGKWPNNTARNTDGSGSHDVVPIFKTPLMRQPNANYPDWNGPYYEGALYDPWGQPYAFVSGYQKDGSNHVAVVSAGSNKTGFRRYDGDNSQVYLDD